MTRYVFVMVLTFLSLVALAFPMQSSALVIASIGDSYASGEGNPDEPQRFDTFGFVKRGPVWTDRQCHRSQVSGPSMAANELARVFNQPLTFIGLSCTGAQTGTGLLRPYDPETDDEHNPLPPQIDQLKSAVGTGKIDLLFVSIGGNDIGFGNLVKNCIIVDGAELIGNAGTLCRNKQEVLDALQTNLEHLPGNYDALAQQLRTMNIGAVLITEYPDPTKGSNGQYCGEGGNSRILFMHPETVRWAYNSTIVPLNSAIHTAAAKHGWIVVPTMAVYERHGYCAKDARWFVTEEESRFIQGPYELGFSERDRLPVGSVSAGSIHPNRAGHEAYARQIVSTAMPHLAVAMGEDIDTQRKRRKLRITQDDAPEIHRGRR